MAGPERTVTTVCQYSSKRAPEYTCKASPVGSAPWCIFHEQDLSKDRGNFRDALKKQLEGRGPNERCSFVGYCFPPDRWNWQELLADHSLVNADFKVAEFRGPTSFRGVNFEGPTLMGSTRFRDDVSFEDVRFEGRVSFLDGEFEGRASFAGAHFQGFADFSGAQFHSHAEFGTASFQAPFFLVGTRLARPEDAESAFHQARESHERSGDRFAADYYFYREIVSKRKQRQRVWDWPFRFLEWLLVDLTCAYGASYMRIIFSAFLIVFAVTVLVLLVGDLKLVNSLVKFDDLPLGKKFLYASYFSVITFTTMGYTDVYPIGELTRALAGIEALMGAFVMTLFVVVFVRKFMR